MENMKFSFKGAIQKLSEYIRTSKDLLFLQGAEAASKVIPAILIAITKLVFAFFLFFYLSISLALFLGELFNSYALGFLITGGIFFLLIVLLSVFGGSIKRGIGNGIVSSFLKKWNDGGDQL